MNRFLSEINCNCKKNLEIIKKKKNIPRNEGKSFLYTSASDLKSKTFYIKPDNNFSLITKFLLNNLQNKYLYYAIDDILYTLKHKPYERDFLLNILYSPVLELQNYFYVSFFDIWIQEIYINEVNIKNKFLKSNSKKLKQESYITIKLLYQVKDPIKTQNHLW